MPTIEKLREAYFEDIDDVYEVVESKTVGKWRHGTEELVIFKRKTDDSFWALNYRADTNGDYNEFRDEDLTDSIRQVLPIEKKIIVYQDIK